MKTVIQPATPGQLKVDDGFWSRYVRLVPGEIIPYQWEMMNDRIPNGCESGCVHNLRVAAGLETGDFIGMPFQDSDLAKWLEAVAFSLENNPDPALEQAADEVIEVVAAAQDADGYLDTCFTLKYPHKRWANLLEGHEMYVVGHFMEAAVAYHAATGKRRLLDVVCRTADLIASLFGPGGSDTGYPGHPELELALYKLYQVTGKPEYLATAKHMLDLRGEDPELLERRRRELWGETFIFPETAKFDRKYMQTHLPLRQQQMAEGHAVRALYLYAAMADIAWETGDGALMETCKTLYSNIVGRRMYLTGSVGSAAGGERFTTDYDLPNHSAYTESCASVALAMFCQRMYRYTGQAKYLDTMESALYNTVAAGISLDGKRFFYVNPLEVWPQAAEHNTDLTHVKTTRQEWFACACCPPNIARTLASLGQYAYFASENTVHIALFVGGEATLQLGEGSVCLRCETRYPFENTVQYEIKTGGRFALAIRQPVWCGGMALQLNDQPITAQQCQGMLLLEREWAAGDRLTLELDMPPRFVAANPLVRVDAGRVALCKGPLVYCLEECDNKSNLAALVADPTATIREVYDPAWGDGTLTLEFGAARQQVNDWGDDELYRPWRQPVYKPVKLRAIPYPFWNNRGRGEMLVWMRAKP